MANILQVTTPSINNRNIIDSQGVKNEAGGPHVQNPVDPTRVVRADGQKNGQASSGGTAPQDGGIPAAQNGGPAYQNQPQGQPVPQGQPAPDPMPGGFTGYESFGGSGNPFF